MHYATESRKTRVEARLAACVGECRSAGPCWHGFSAPTADLGKEVVGGHPCDVIESASSDGATVTRYYAARDLRGLIVKAVVARDSGEWMSFQGLELTLVDDSLDPPESRFRVPAGYRESPDLRVAVEPLQLGGENE